MRGLHRAVLVRKDAAKVVSERQLADPTTRGGASSDQYTQLLFTAR